MSRSVIPDPAHNPGDVVHGFRVDAVTPLSDIKALVYEVTHERTGAQVLHVHCNDEENMFSVGFRTPPADSTGVAHILEHSVLAGSDKYPVKDAFKELGKRTLNTFLNAMTWPDRTVYPTCSPVRADYFNLARVYSDLVFNPKLKRQTFEQEGHHLELEDAEDPESALIVKGIVYNEMKGVYSSPESYIYRELGQQLMPDTVYGHDSGGDPDRIPDLTYEQFVAFHRQFYSPSNARFMLYGDITLDDNLSFLEEILGPFDAVEVDSNIEKQAHWDAPREHKVDYVVGEEDSLDKKTFVVLTWLTCDTADTMETLLLDVAMDAISGSSAGPLRKALIDSQLGEDVFPGGGLSGGIKQTSVSVGLRGTETEHIETIEALIFDTLRGIIADGIDPELIEACFHRFEFAGKEINPPFPIQLMYRANSLWYFDADPKEGLQFSSLVDTARTRYAAEPRVFERSLQRWLIDNPHRLRLIATPSNTLAAEQKKAQQEKLAALKASLSPDALAEIQRNAQALKAAQEAPELPENIAKLPEIKLEDIPRPVRTIPTVRRDIGATRCCEHEAFSNDIGYVSLTFDIRDLDPALTAYLPLLSHATTSMGAAGLAYDAMSTRISRHTGGISASPGTGRNLHTGARYTNFHVGSSALTREAEPLFAILKDVLTAPDPRDTKRFSDLLKMSYSRLKSAVVPRGHSFAYISAAASLDLTLWQREQWQGLSQLRLRKEILDDLDARLPQVIDTVARLQAELFTRSRLMVNISGDPEVISAFRPHLEALVEALPVGTPVAAERDGVLPPSRDLGLVVPSQVNYVGQVLSVPRLTDPSAPALEMLAHVIKEEFLYKKLRVQGGAYGGFSFYDGTSGLFPMLSYRDPNLLETLAAYEGTLDFVREELNDGLVDGLRIGVIGGLDRVLSAAQKLGVARGRYLLGLTTEDRQAFRDGIFSVDADAIRALALPHLEAALEAAPRAVLASREALTKANEALTRKFDLIELEEATS